MKRLLVCLLFGLGVGGCASVSSPASVVATEVDYQRMALIERAAARSGVQVIWLHAPTKKVSAAGS